MSDSPVKLTDVDELLRETLDLQPSFVPRGSPEMERRGIIVRREIPAWLRAQLPTLTQVSAIEDLRVAGSDGSGLKAEIPWVRVFSKQASPRPTQGWYLVYLFSAGGHRAYLSLIQGTTRYDGQQLTARDPEELTVRARWARAQISAWIDKRADLVQRICLDSVKGKVGPGYEIGTVVAIGYDRYAIPQEPQLESDLVFMVRLLSDLYRAEDEPPEIVEATAAAALAAGRRGRPPMGQGRGLNAEERRAVELRGVRLAIEYFRDDGWTVKDVGETKSYDLRLSRGAERLYVEVKGTTSLGQQVVLTRSEVEAQRGYHPDNALVLVHSIALDRTSSPPKASGGVLRCISPWSIVEEDLKVISYSCKTWL